jgi:hypothetical protein
MRGHFNNLRICDGLGGMRRQTGFQLIEKIESAATKVGSAENRSFFVFLGFA